MENAGLNYYEQARAERDLAAIEIERLAYDIRDAQLAYNNCRDSTDSSISAEKQRVAIDHEQQQLARHIITMIEERMQYAEMYAGAERSMRRRLEHTINDLHQQLASCSERMRQAQSPRQQQAAILQCDHTRAQLSQAEQILFALTDERSTKRIV
jgi:hypothetical protein